MYVMQKYLACVSQTELETFLRGIMFTVYVRQAMKFNTEISNIFSKHLQVQTVHLHCTGANSSCLIINIQISNIFIIL
jgi:hypothetical protein